MSLDFVAIDVETVNWDRGSICSFGWATVRDGQIIDTGSRLCRPPEELDWFSGFNIAIHGIAPKDVATEPRFGDLVPEILDSFGELPVVAHNAAFDIGAIREAYTYSGLSWPSLSYGCTLVWSRRLLDLPSHRLPVVCDFLGFPLVHHHDAGCDARAAGKIVLALSKSVDAASLDDLLNATYSRLGHLAPGEWFGCHVRDSGGGSRPTIPTANLDSDPDNPFYGQRIVFTGGLSCMVRRVAFQCVAEAGGYVQQGVTKKTSLLVLGDGFSGDTLNDFLTTQKARKSLDYRAKGQPIEFWSEVDFVEALITADVAPFNTGTPGSPTLALPKERTLFASLPREAWEPQETYPGVSSPYWRWFAAHLSSKSRATGGEPCRICDQAIKRNANWKFRDRHVCSSECNSRLKRRFKSAVARGEILEYNNPAIDLDAPVQRPRMFVALDDSKETLG